jgi:hypothetical protein
MLVESLMNAQNHEVQSTLNQLSHLYGHDPLESGGTVYFTNPPTFNYTVKDNMGTFWKHEKNHHKAYVE